jgi:hypothetical protein
MKKIIFAFATMAISSTVLAMGVPPQAAVHEAEAEKVIPQTELVKVRTAEQTIRNARAKGASTDAEIKASAKFHKAAENAVYEAVRLRLALDRAGFDKQAAIVFANKDKACAILSGC